MYQFLYNLRSLQHWSNLSFIHSVTSNFQLVHGVSFKLNCKWSNFISLDCFWQLSILVLHKSFVLNDAMSNHSIVHVVSLNLYFSLNWVTNNLHCLCLWYCFNFQSWFHIKPYVHDAISNHLIIHHVVSLNLDLLSLLFKPFIYLVLRQTFELFQVFYQSLMWQNSTSFNCHPWCYVKPFLIVLMLLLTVTIPLKLKKPFCSCNELCTTFNVHGIVKAFV